MAEFTQLKHILVADDSPTIHKAVRLTLPENEFKVTVASNGKEALECVKSGKVDLVLADVNMPELNGYDLSQAIKIRLALEIPVILMCGTFDKFDQDRFIWSKANHRIWKPFETTSFLEIVRQYLKPHAQTSKPVDRSVEKPVQEKRITPSHVSSVSKDVSQMTKSVPRREPQEMRSRVTPPNKSELSPELTTETPNMGFQVETEVRKWLASDAGKALIREIVKKEVSQVLSKIEAELIESLRQAPIEEDTVPTSSKVNVVNPF